MRRYAIYTFVFSLLWLGFVGAENLIISSAVSDTTHAFEAAARSSLNRVEWICCAFSWLLMLRIRVVRERGSMILLGLITAALAYQSWGLLTELESHARVLKLTDAAKGILLAVLAAMQIQSFARAVISE